MVDRLFWRAGFGPPTDAAARASWVGHQVSELVDWFLNTPAAVPDYATRTTPPPPRDADRNIIDPLASDQELELEWLDRMQRAVNPFPDRLAFFWHRHWAISREDGGIPLVFVTRYRDLLLKYAEFATYPNATFKQLATAMTTTDAAMSMYLNMNQNVRGKPNENYAREFMELFCLGPNGPDGTPNYTQDDVAGLAKAFTGWSLNTTATTGTPPVPNPNYGVITFTASRYELPAKTFLGLTQPTVTQTQANAVGFGTMRIDEAVSRVLAHVNHAQFLIRKLWAEFHASPIPQATLDTLVADYKTSGYALKPLLRSILMHPLLFESIDEPNLVKAPVVALVGMLRALDAPLQGNTMESAMIAMQQRIYNPPNVAGWEGGMAWFNTNTVQARFDLALKVQNLKYGTLYDGTAHPVAVFGADVNAAYTEALKAANSPWLSSATANFIKTYAGTLPGTSDAQKRGRFYAIQALMLGGPDGQVM
jgi:uncharacterized protein (DUF1800 family)